MRWRVRRTTRIITLLAAFLGGLLLANIISIAIPVHIVVLSFVLVPLLWRRTILSMLSIIVFGLVFGWWRGAMFKTQLVPYSVWMRQSVVLIAKADEDAEYDNRRQLSFDTSSVQLRAADQMRSIKLPGTIGVSGFGVPMVNRGDTVEVRGKLYPARGSRQAYVSFAGLQIITKDHSLLNKLRRNFAAGLQSVLPATHGSFMLGLLIGRRSTLPPGLTADLSTVGLTHIVAVSGYNLTILVRLAQRLLAKISKRQALVFTLILISGFVAICGGSSSIVRAAVVAVLSIWASYFGRSFRPLMLVLLPAALTAGWFPPYLWGDIGWYLSFMAFCGILMLAPIIIRRWWVRENPGIIGQLMVETSSAQLLTLPLILFIFGKLSVVSLLANMMVLPFIPIAMALGMIAGLAGLIVPIFSGWLAWPSRWLLVYILDIVNWLARWPIAAVDVGLAWWHMAIGYLVILGLALTWRRGHINGKIQIKNRGDIHGWSQ